MDRLTLANIQALAVSVDYGGDGNISPSSAALGLSAALFLSDLSLWQGAGNELTDGEIDDIKAMIAGLECDLMLTGVAATMPRVKTTLLANQSIPSGGFHFLNCDVDIYDTDEIHEGIINPRLYVIKTEGMYILTANITWEANTVGLRQMYLSKFTASTGLVTPEGADFKNAVAFAWTFTNQISYQDYFYVGDELRIQVRNSSPVSLDILAGRENTQVSLTKV